MLGFSLTKFLCLKLGFQLMFRNEFSNYHYNIILYLSLFTSILVLVVKNYLESLEKIFYTTENTLRQLLLSSPLYVVPPNFTWLTQAKHKARPSTFEMLFKVKVWFWNSSESINWAPFYRYTYLGIFPIIPFDF